MSMNYYLVIMVLFLAAFMVFPADAELLPMVKQWQPETGTLNVHQVAIQTADAALEPEADLLREWLGGAGVSQASADAPAAAVIRLKLAALDLPVRASDYRESLLDQGYELKIGKDEIHVSGRTQVGVHYGIQTLRQFFTQDAGAVPLGTIRDWPDLSVRMIMLDMARQMEHPDYYRRVIEFCARYKMNALHLHLTDDEYSCLYHEDYTSIMHYQAFRAEQIRDLVEYAGRYHIELIPEIESLGHSRLFIRHPEAGRILHQASDKRSVHAIPGYTNVLCPASPQAHAYIQKMYALCAELFPSATLHIGFDEVNMTGCERCQKKWPEKPAQELFLDHLQCCTEYAQHLGKKVGVWDDMFRRVWTFDMEVLKAKLPPEQVVIYNWLYYDNLKTEVPARYKAAGYDVIGCPALMSSHHMVYSDPIRLGNVRKFALIAHDNDLQGLDTTVWLPQRYLSDAMWPGFAYAAQQSWAGGANDDQDVFSAYLRDYHGSAEGEKYAKIWQDLAAVRWFRNDIVLSCWHNEKTLAQAAEEAGKNGPVYQGYLEMLTDVRRRLAEITPTVTRQQTQWQTFEQSLGVMEWSVRRMLAAPDIHEKKSGYEDKLNQIRQDGQDIMEWIIADWDRNRFADDLPGKNLAFGAPEGHILFLVKRSQGFPQKE